MRNEDIAAQNCLAYKKMAELVEMVQWLANLPIKPIERPEPAHFFNPPYYSAGDPSTSRPSTPVIDDHARHLFKTYYRPACPGEFIFKEFLYYNRVRLFLRVVKRHAPHVTIEVLDFLDRPDTTNPRCIRANETYLMRLGYVDPGPAGIGEHYLLALGRWWHLVTTQGRRAMDTLMAPMVWIWYKFLDYYYGYKFRDEDRFMAELQSQTVN